MARLNAAWRVLHALVSLLIESTERDVRAWRER